MIDFTETLSLIRKAQAGSEEAKERLLFENSPLIKSVIKRYINKGLEYDDLYQLGCLGFLKAISNFDESYGVKFSTYVVPMVMGEVKRFMRDDGSIKVSRAIKSLNIQINRYIEEFIKTNSRKPEVEEIASYFEVDCADVVFAMDSAKMPISIYTPFGEDDDSKGILLIDRFQSEGGEDAALDGLGLRDAVANLEERDKLIILMRYFNDKTQSEIANRLKISQVQVSRLENKILEKIKKKMV